MAEGMDVADSFVCGDLEIWAREAGGLQLSAWRGREVTWLFIPDEDARQLRDWLNEHVKDAAVMTDTTDTSAVRNAIMEREREG